MHQNQKRRDLLLDLSYTRRKPTFSNYSTFTLHFYYFLRGFEHLLLGRFSFLWVYVLFSFKGDCLIIFSYSFRFSWQVYVSFLMLPVMFIGFCYFSLDL